MDSCCTSNIDAIQPGVGGDGLHPGLNLVLLPPDPARVVNMPPVIYVPIGIHGYIRCPVEAEPPVTLVKWNKDGRPLRIEKVREQ